MKSYDNYIEVSSRWAQYIPASWTFSKIAEVFIERKESNNPVRTTDILSLTNTRGVIPHKEKGNIGNKAKEDLTGYRLAYPGDIVFNSMNAVIGSVGLSKYFGAVSPVYYMLYLRDPIGNNIRFFDYVFQNKVFQSGLNGLGNGILDIRMRIPMSKLKYVGVPVPPRAEQDQIVRYLDWQVSKINRLIAAKRKQIEHLIECEQKIISKVLLRGLHSKPLKNSGNSWIGDIPANWSVLKLGNFCSFQNGISESGDFFTSGTPFVGYGDVYRHLELPKHVKGVAMSNEQQQEIFSVRKGDIFFTRTSENIKEIGMASVCKSTIEKAVFSGFIIRCRPQAHIVDTDFIKYYLQIPAVRNHFSSKMNIVIRASLGQALLKQTPVVIPPIHEQQEIALYLDEKHDKYDKIKRNILWQIDALAELKTRLISDVVTGQIDVRGIEIPDFEYAPDNDAADDEDISEQEE